MESVQHGAVDEQNESKRAKVIGDSNRQHDTVGKSETHFVPLGDKDYNLKSRSVQSNPRGSSVDENSLWYKYTHEANSHNDREAKRSKRTAKSESRNKSTCSLYIQTDPLLWKHVYESEKRNPENTRKEITSLIAQHVKAVNAIYMDTKFDGKYPHRMTRFEVQRIKIDDYEACDHHNGLIADENSKFCLPNIDVSNFLNLHSQGDHEAFCLAYVFTYR